MSPATSAEFALVAGAELALAEELLGAELALAEELLGPAAVVLELPGLAAVVLELLQPARAIPHATPSASAPASRLLMNRSPSLR